MSLGHPSQLVQSHPLENPALHPTQRVAQRTEARKKVLCPCQEPQHQLENQLAKFSAGVCGQGPSVGVYTSRDSGTGMPTVLLRIPLLILLLHLSWSKL